MGDIDSSVSPVKCYGKTQNRTLYSSFSEGAARRPAFLAGFSMAEVGEIVGLEAPV